MAKLRVVGGTPLNGIIETAGNKNAVLPIMAATLLTDEPCILNNVPRISDVDTMAALLRELGVEVEWRGDKQLRISARTLTGWSLDTDLVRKMRASVLLLGPLLVRMGRARTHQPGGCVIGRRDIGTHLAALEALGTIVHNESDGLHFYLETSGLVGRSIFLDEASVTATENSVMAAVLARGTTVLKHAASEPHVQDLCRFLVSMGAQIEGIGSNVLTIHGVERLHGTEHSIVPDHHEVGTFAVAAAVTHGDVRIINVVPEHLDMIALQLERLGVDFSISDNEMHVYPSALQAPTNIRSMRKITTNIWPGFPTDLASPFIVLATQCEGTTLIHDWMFEGRMFFVDKLVGMGANIVLCDPHRCVVTGPTPLQGRQLQSPDLRAGVALVIAALCANGASEISEIELVQRGYEKLVERLSALGANLEMIGRPEPARTNGIHQPLGPLVIPTR